MSKANKDGLQSRCKACVKNYTDKRYLENKGSILKANKIWRDNNPEQCKKSAHERYVRYFEKNTERLREQKRKYAKEHREQQNKNQKNYLKTDKGRTTERKRQFKRRDVQRGLGRYTKEQFRYCLEFFNYKCAYTGKELNNDNMHIDHVIPISHGGGNDIWNLVPSANKANESKGDSEMEVWYRNQEYFSEDRLEKIYEWIKIEKTAAHL